MRASHYEVLGVEPGATGAQLKAAYRRKLKTVHPDSGGSEEAFEALQVAWSVVGNAEKRREYDRWLADVRPVMGGSRLAVQQRYEERELAAERAAWDARRAEARRVAAERAAAQKQAAEAKWRDESEHVGIHRHLSLAVAALVVVVTALEMLAGDSMSSGSFVVFGTEVPLPPEGTTALMVQLGLGVLLAVGAIVSGGPACPGEEACREVPLWRSGAFRVVLGTVAALLAALVLVPFVLAVI